MVLGDLASTMHTLGLPKSERQVNHQHLSLISVSAAMRSFLVPPALLRTEWHGMTRARFMEDVL